jgi:hypothetical protein
MRCVTLNQCTCRNLWIFTPPRSTTIDASKFFHNASTRLGTPLELWMGTWDRGVILDRWISNCKELLTLIHTLQHEASLPTSQVRDRRVYYFTNNSTVYHLARRG